MPWPFSPITTNPSSGGSTSTGSTTGARLGDIQTIQEIESGTVDGQGNITLMLRGDANALVLEMGRLAIDRPAAELLGEDGHVASLFPDRAADSAEADVIAGLRTAHSPHPRRLRAHPGGRHRHRRAG